MHRGQAPSYSILWRLRRVFDRRYLSIVCARACVSVFPCAGPQDVFAYMETLWRTDGRACAGVCAYGVQCHALPLPLSFAAYVSALCLNCHA